MKTFTKILIISFSLLICTAAQAQEVTGVQDSLAVKQQKEMQTGTQTQTQTQTQKQTQTQAGAYENTAVKQVRSARPDMSKAKGARPGSIVRPSGSGIPKGVGRPRGAGGPGKR